MIPREARLYLRLAVAAALATAFALAYQPELERLGASLRADRPAGCLREIVRISNGTLWIECSVPAPAPARAGS